jgi:2-hydroxy-6-oxonona-2,4-dienedioate hydrolase
MLDHVLDGLLYRGAPARLRGRYRIVGGTRTYERSAAAPGAPRVVLLHGVGVSGRYLLPTAGRLAARCSVHVPDLPGFGRSDPLPGRPTIGGLAAALEAWLDAAGLEEVDALVANSFGCQVALVFAAARPERVRRLVLTGPTVDSGARSLPRQVARLALDAVREPLPLIALQAYDYAVHVGKSGGAALAAMLRDAPEVTAARVQAPVLVVRGGRDLIVPRRWAEELAAALPRGRLVEIPGAPHAVNYTAPDALARLTLEVLGLEPAPVGRPAPALHSGR